MTKIQQLLKRLPKILLTSIVVLLILCWGVKAYSKYFARQRLTDDGLNSMLNEINSAPRLPQNFKDTYVKVYPNIFKDNFNSTLVDALFSEGREACPSTDVSFEYHVGVVGKSFFMRKLKYAGFVWIVEDHFSQERCFEFCASRMDFLYHTRGVHEAAKYFYKKPLDSLTIDEQLGIILKMSNPAHYDSVRHPEATQSAINGLKDRIALRDSE